jgi:soluble lytic murein transglycosylase-like protein
VIRPYAESATEEDFLRFGREYLSAMLAYFGGDVEKALAAYNAGAGSVNKAVRNAGDNWLESMSAQTKGYVPNIMSMFTRAGQ